jgi:hypothetical protein
MNLRGLRMGVLEDFIINVGVQENDNDDDVDVDEAMRKIILEAFLRVGAGGTIQ